LPANLAKR